MLSLHPRLPQDRALLLQERSPRHLEHHLEALLALLRVLLEALCRHFFELVPDLRPAAAQRRDLRALLELGLAGGVRGGRGVDACFADVEEVRPCEVHRAEGDAALGGVDVGSLVHEGCVLAAEQGDDEFGRGLLAGYEAFCAELLISLARAMGERTGLRTMPVDGSTVRDRVSTAMTCLQLSFQGPYFRQLLVLTSSHE
jgi:hypothetical protein